MRLKFATIATVAIMTQSLILPVTTIFAESTESTTIVGLEELNITEVELKQTGQNEKELILELKNTNEEAYDEVITEFMNETTNPIVDSALEYFEGEIENSNIVYDDSLITEYNIDDDTSVIFTPTDIILDVLEVSDEEFVTDPEALKEFEDEHKVEKNIFSKAISFIFSGNTVQAASTRMKTATHTRVYYAQALGQKVLSVGIGAEFTYNGSTVTARTTENWTKKHWGSLATWQLRGSKNGMQKPNSKRRIAFQEATFAQGITVKGNGLVFQTRYLRANVEGTASGSIYKTSSSR